MVFVSFVWPSFLHVRRPAPHVSRDVCVFLTATTASMGEAQSPGHFFHQRFFFLRVRDIRSPDLI